MENTNIGLVDLNDQYRLNTSKSKRMGNSFVMAGNTNIRGTSGKQRSNSQGSGEK